MLITIKEILTQASKENYAVAAANVGTCMEVNAAIEAAEELRAPLILDVLPVNIMPCPTEFCHWALARCKAASVPLALNLDDNKTFTGAIQSIQYGATSIMVNRSALPFEENVAEVKTLTQVAHAAGVGVEAELGGFGPNGEVDELGLASPAGAVRFIQETDADCLAVTVRVDRPDGQPGIDFPRLALIKEAVGDYPLVLHGSLGIPVEQLQKACTMGLNKINLSKDLKAAALQSVLAGGSGNVVDLMKAGFKGKLLELIPHFGSAGKA